MQGQKADVISNDLFQRNPLLNLQSVTRQKLISYNAKNKFWRASRAVF
jgi:hypothetical protein